MAVNETNSTRRRMKDVGTKAPNFAMKERAAYSIRDLMAMTGLSETSVYRQIKAGKLKTIKIGGRTLVTAAALNAWLSD